MGFFSKKKVNQENLSQQRNELTAFENKLNSLQKTLNNQKAELMQKEQSVFKREQDLGLKIAGVMEKDRLLTERSLKISQQEKSLERKSQELFEKEAAFTRDWQALELLRKELDDDIRAAQDNFDFPALAPTFDRDVFSSFALGDALLHYDYQDNPRLFSALRDEIVLRKNRVDVIFTAISESGTEYTVTLDGCTCPDFLYRHQPCKHMYRLAVALGWVSRSREEEIQQKEIKFAETQRKENKKLESKRKELREYERDIDRQQAVLENSWQDLHEFVDDELDHLNDHKEFIDKLVLDTMDAFPYIATALIDYEYTRREMELSEYLRTKPHPAVKASEEIRKISLAKRKLAIHSKILEYKLELYEAAAPWLKDFDVSAQDLKEALEHEDEKYSDEYELLKSWLSPEEYQKLSTAEKYQLALDRYKTRQKSNWAAGIEYERYIGYLYETQGFHVYYSGALKGVEDLGRDLIASKNSEVYIIQCKRWSASKTIHEKHVFQLFGSVFDYQLRHSSSKVKGKLIATCAFSRLAAQYAEKLNIEFESMPFDPDYPMIKCNISNTGKIYHLPFDQQYDRVVITPSSGEFYAATVAEAEARGFTRAKRWHGTGTT